MNPTTQTNVEEPKNENDPRNNTPPAPPPNLALIPLRPASKKKQVEFKQLPIVLGRTNLSQWWYQSCDCYGYGYSCKGFDFGLFAIPEYNVVSHFV